MKASRARRSIAIALAVLTAAVMVPASATAAPKTTTVVKTIAPAKVTAPKAKAKPKVDLVTVPTDKHGRVDFDESTGAVLAKIPVGYFKDMAHANKTTAGFEQDIAGCYIAYPTDGPRWKKASKATRAVLREGLSDCIGLTIKYHKMYR